MKLLSWRCVPSPKSGGIYIARPYFEVGDQLVSDVRAAVQDCVRRNPGIHFNALRRQLDIATGQTQYHIRRLLRADELTSEEVCGRTHYYPPTYTAWERGVIALLRRETTREIVLELLEENQQPPATLTDRLNLARSTVEWHLSNLAEHDMVEKQTITDSNGTEQFVVELAEPDTVYRLLREIEPRPSDRLADRFARLTDQLLAGGDSTSGFL